MRRILLSVVALLLGSTALLALYVVWDDNPNNVSPMVDAPTYQSLFEQSVKQRTTKQFAQLDEPGRRKVLSDIILSREADPVREVALFHVRELADKDFAFNLLRKNLANLSPDLYEVAVGSVSALGHPKGMQFLDSLYQKLNLNPTAHTPLGGYRNGYLLASNVGSDLNFSYQEQTRQDADYAKAQTNEMTLLFPAGPEYFVAFPNADDVLERFNHSKFVTTLDGSPVPEDAWSLPLLRTVKAIRSRLGDGMGVMSKYFSPEQLFRDNLLIGKYGDNYLLSSFKDKNVSLAESLIKVFQTLGKDFGLKQWQIEGVQINAAFNSATHRALCYATVKDYFVIATDTALISQAIHTYQSDRAHSIGIDPLFKQSYAKVDQTGKRDVMFAWFNATEYFDITGSKDPASRRLTILARALGKQLDPQDGSHSAAETVASIPGVFASTTLTGDEASTFWKYVTVTRTVGKNSVDSLSRLAGIDVAKQIMPYFSSSLGLGYAGVSHLKRDYGYANTGFSVVALIPLKNTPAGFDYTLTKFFGAITSLIYTRDSSTGSNVAAWLAHDTSTHDTLLGQRKLQPSFAIVNGNVLVVGSTPEMLRRAVASITNGATGGSPSQSVFSGSIRVDSLASNSNTYLKSYLLRSDQYTPQDIAKRLDPLKNALSLYRTLDWNLAVQNGLRHAEGRLIAAK